MAAVAGPPGTPVVRPVPLAVPVAAPMARLEPGGPQAPEPMVRPGSQRVFQGQAREATEVQSRLPFPVVRQEAPEQPGALAC